MNAIQLENVSKRLGRKQILDRLSWRLPRGSVCGLLGRNGAGKSTLLKTLMGLWRADEGDVQVLGQTPRPEGFEALPVAYVGEGPVVPGFLKVREAIAFEARFRAGFNSEALSAWEKHFDQRVRTLSKGQARQLELDLALAWPSKLLLLDEPFDGLDPVVRAETMQRLIAHVADHEATVLVSSHTFSDFERLCDRFGVLANGKIALEEDIDLLRGAIRQVVGPKKAVDGLGLSLQILGRRFEAYGQEMLLLRNLDDDAARALVGQGFVFVNSNVEQLGIELLRCLDAGVVKHA